jgi:phage shock protein PspC (stress-responsive transcriptional regulator)
MKKTISINISGILFHIEEDGYTSLKNYLDAINQHFSLYEDNQEIISDIENRIAEIFLSNLKNNKQVITAENVSALIEKMGTIADFQASALDLGEEKSDEGENDFYKYITPPEQKSGKAYKKLTRLANAKILGGVCAGFANYFSIDPLWTRLITILLVFSGGLDFRTFPLPFFSDGLGISMALGWWTLIAYVLLWIILPVSYEKPEDKHIKKLYRNPDDRVLGGVGSGLAAYFNLDVIWMRLAFVGLIFAGGSGFVLYLILWIITPVAKSITERIEMKGGAITLSNIETTIKQNLSAESTREDSTVKKLILAPFRFLGMVINGIGKALGPFGRFLVEMVRVIFGLAIFFAGMLILVLPLAFLGIYTDILSNEGWTYVLDGFPIDSLVELLPIWLAIAASILVLIPSIVLVILGISVLIKRNLIDGRFGLVLFGIWLACILLVAFQVPKIISQFKVDATHALEQELDIPSGTLVLRAEDSLLDTNDWGLVNLELRGHATDKILLNQSFSSKGSTYEDALQNASSVDYTVQLTDSVMVFGKILNFPDGTRFRMQQLDQRMYLPYNQPFVMDRSLLPLLRNTLARDGYKNRDISGSHHWVFNEEGLLCLNCINDHNQSPADSASRAQFKDRYFMK